MCLWQLLILGGTLGPKETADVPCPRCFPVWSLAPAKFQNVWLSLRTECRRLPSAVGPGRRGTDAAYTLGEGFVAASGRRGTSKTRAEAPKRGGVPRASGVPQLEQKGLAKQDGSDAAWEGDRDQIRKGLECQPRSLSANDEQGVLASHTTRRRARSPSGTEGRCEGRAARGVRVQGCGAQWRSQPGPQQGGDQGPRSEWGRAGR